MTVALAALLATGCAGTSQAPDATPAPVPAPQIVGGDRDAHGCIASAGYSWCARERSCVRPWELAKTAGFEDTPQGFERYCAAPQPAPAERRD